MRADEDWLSQYRKEHPNRVHDDAQEQENGSLIHSACWEFDTLPMLYNEVLGAQKYRPADYYKHRNAWVQRFNVKAREASGGPGAILFTPALIHMVRRSTAVPDVDGLYGSFKVILDALVDAGLIPDDDPSAVAALQAEHDKVKHQDQQGTVLRIAPA